MPRLARAEGPSRVTSSPSSSTAPALAASWPDMMLK
jgi:hypothetical protein